MPSYDAYQSTYYLSMLANITSHFETSDVDLLGRQYVLAIAPKIGVPDTPIGGHRPAQVQPAVVDLIGAWSLAWGPAVQLEGASASNSTYVAHNPGVQFDDGVYPAYVVAVAGTDPYSAFDWIAEDADVIHWYDFNAILAGEGEVEPAALLDGVKLDGPYISAGTKLGLERLLALKPASAGVATGQTLSAFLSSIQDRKARLIFTGHSLGGALSPTLALYLAKKGVLGGFESVRVYPTAGPTPGNTDFAALFASVFPPAPAKASSYAAWNTNITNGRDVVPHAWALETLVQIYGIYGNSEAHPLPWDVKLPISIAIGASSYALKHGMEYGRINHWIGHRPFECPPPETFKQFLTYLGEEHVDAYSTGGICSGEPGIIVPEPPTMYWDLVPILPGITFR